MNNSKRTDGYNSKFDEWHKYNPGGKLIHEPWGADAEPVYNVYEVEYESTLGSSYSSLSQTALSKNIRAVTFTIDKEQRFAMFYDGYGVAVAVVYNVLSIKLIPSEDK